MALPSFFIGGFECADHINRLGQRVDMLRETGHDARAAEDYALLRANGIRTVREGIRWSMVECRPFEYDFSEVIHRIHAGLDSGITQCWDLCHFGYPDDMMPTHPLFPARFAALCQAFVQMFRSVAPDAPLIITPINEISFLAWHSGDVRGTVPFMVNSGWDVKYHLCKAAIAGIRAIRAMDATARILLVDPIIQVHPRPGFEEDTDHCARVNEEQFQALDLIAGRICPELGGSPDFLDILGFNYYHNNQWEHCGDVLWWEEYRDERRHPLVHLLEMAKARYGDRPMVITETGHFGSGRANWIRMITGECLEAIDRGVNLQGACIYPIIDRPDWDHLHEYIPCGLWGYDEAKSRIPHEEGLAALAESREQIRQHFAVSV